MNTSSTKLVRVHFLRAVAVVYVLVGCAFSDAVFNLPREQIQKEIYDGHYDILRNINSDSDLSSVDKLHDGAQYYLSNIYQSLELPEIANTLRYAEWTKNTGPWRYKAGLDILRSLSNNREFNLALPIARRGVRLFEQDRHYLYYYLEASYWQKEYARVISLLPSFRAYVDFEQKYSVNQARKYSAEAQLWEAVSRYRGDIHYQQSVFETLFFDYSASVYHTRVYEYIIDEPKLRASFTKWQLALFEGKHLNNLRIHSGAAKAYERLFRNMPHAAYNKVLTPRTIRDIGRAYFYGGYSKAGIERFTTLADKVSGVSRATLLEWVGRLHIRSEEYQSAQQVLQSAYREHPSDRVLWLLFDAAFSHSFANGIVSMQQHAVLIRNPRYYSDIFDRQIVAALRGREWDYLWQLRDIIIKYGSAYDRAHIAVVIAESVRIGVTSLPDGIRMLHIRNELEIARKQTDSAHYAYLAALMLKKSARHTVTYSYQYQRDTSLSQSECRKLIDGYWYFHLIQDGYSQLRSCITWYTTPELIAIAQELYARNIFNYAIRVLDIARSRNDFVINKSIERILYPRAYSQFIDTIAAQNSISQYFFYSTIREESYFTSTINSHAGAVGLGQFIPSTARAVANQMNVPYPDLTDPEQNLRLSGFHLSELIAKLNNKPLFALAAYNAGIGRARKWLLIHDDYSDMLKHESIHFHETRHYIRKIMVTHIQYARIYENRIPEHIVKKYFTDLAPL